MKIIEQNKKAYFDYFIDETVEAGIALVGCEVKSVRAGNISLKESFCHIEGGEVILKNCHIAPYEMGNINNVDSRRDRKLLLHKREITRLIGKVKEKGFTLIPTKIYFSGRRIKLELGLGKGKHSYDKRESIKKRDIERDLRRQLS